MAIDRLAINDDELDQISGGSVLPFIVRKGDSLKSIADNYHVTVEQLIKWNHIQNPDEIREGQFLRILF
jgi:FOG: LysM repeat